MPSTLQHNPYGFENQTRLVLARSAALDTLVGELRKYLGEEVQGRNCLIAGPRGSGKTTLVNTAFDEVRDFSPNKRLIQVRIHGPSLLTPSAEVAHTPGKLYEHVLKILIINLYQTVAEELANAYRASVRGHGGESRELAAQLRLTLDGAPSASTLRFFWERAGALSRGVLRSNSPEGQGLAEVVALATAAEAYRSCIGSVTREQKTGDNAVKKDEVKSEVSAKGKEIAHSIVSLASGLAVGAAAAQQADLATSALAGAVTTIASMATLTFTSTRSREVTAKEELTFLPDTTVSSLVHRVPLLLRRLRQAGLVPVFVVDELDKITDLAGRLTDIASYLKFLCADQAFFCFLTDRAYIVQTARKNRSEVNSRERTIFTNLLFLLYDSQALHEFLRQVIRPGSRDEGVDAEALRYVLIHRSRMLLFELAREISAIRDPQGMLHLGPQGPRGTLVHQFHLMLQLAVETIISRPAVTERIIRDPDFGQVIHEALLYPTQLWYLGQSTIIECSREELIDGMTQIYGGSTEIPEDDQNYLQAQVKSLLELVADPQSLEYDVRTALKAGQLRLDAVDEICKAIPVFPRLLVHVEGDRYQWQYNRYGVAHDAATVITITSSGPVNDAEYACKFLSSMLVSLPFSLPVARVLADLDASGPVLNLFARLEIPNHDDASPDLN